jgi:hypothetical protein
MARVVSREKASIQAAYWTQDGIRADKKRDA